MRGALEGPPHDRPLDADPAAVDQADLAETRGGGGLDVGRDGGGGLARTEGVEVEGVLQGDRDGRFRALRRPSS